MDRAGVNISLSRVADAILLLQPFLTFPLFVAVLLGMPPLWVAWLIAAFPIGVRLVTTRRLTKRTPFDIPVLIFILGMTIGFLICTDRVIAGQILNSCFASILFYYGIVNNGRSCTWYWIAMGVFFSLILIVLALWMFSGGIVKHVVFNEWIFELVGGFTLPFQASVHANVIGGSLAVAIPALIGIFLSPLRKDIRITTGITAVVFIVILSLSASSGGWFAALGGILVVLFFYPRKRYIITATALVVIIGISFIFWNDASWVPIVVPLNSITGRLELWKEAVPVLGSHLFTGLSFGEWWSQATLYPPQGGWHNAYIQLVSDAGITGLLALLTGIWACGIVFKRIIRSDKSSVNYMLGIAMFGAIVSGALHACVDVNTNALIISEDSMIYFAIPYLWLFLSFFVVVYHRIGDDAE